MQLPLEPQVRRGGKAPYRLDYTIRKYALDSEEVTGWKAETYWMV